MVQESDGSVATSTPWCDSGDLYKWLYNCNFKVQRRNKTLKECEITYVLGSGSYDGAQTTNWANEAVERLLYFSYRNRFPPLLNGATTDTNWGCMIRSGQMMLGYAFMRFFNAGKARIDENVDFLRKKTQILFLDLPTAPFGVHAITREGVNQGVECGKWFGPTPLATTLSRVGERYVSTNGEGPAIVSCLDRLVRASQVRLLLAESRHVVLLIPAMMGFGTLSEKYARFIIRLLEMESSIGLVGGRQRAALYLCGHQEEDIFFLDPHYVQRAFVSPERAETLSSVRGTLTACELETSMLLGFYISSFGSFDKFQAEITEINAPLTFPLISVTSSEEPPPEAHSADGLHCVFLED